MKSIAIIYELFLQQNPDPTYSDSVFPAVFLATFFTALGAAVVFYLLINRRSAGFHTRKHWAIVLGLVNTLAFGYSMFISKFQIAALSFDSYMMIFGVINFFLAGILFFLFSLVLKQFSIYSKKVPF